MAKTTIKWEGLDEAIKGLENLEGFILEESKFAVNKGLVVTLGEIEKRTPHGATSNLAQSLQLSPAKIKRGHVIGYGFSPLIYAWAVEAGRPAGTMPPVEAIEYWVVRKLGVSGPEASSVAFAIANAIKARGTKGVFMFQEGLKAATPTIKKILSKIIPDAIKRGGNGSS